MVNSISTIGRHLSSPIWNHERLDPSLDHKDRNIAARSTDNRDSNSAYADKGGDSGGPFGTVETLCRVVMCGPWHRAMFLIGFADGLRRSEIVDFDLKAVSVYGARHPYAQCQRGTLLSPLLPNFCDVDSQRVVTMIEVTTAQFIRPDPTGLPAVLPRDTNPPT